MVEQGWSRQKRGRTIPVLAYFVNHAHGRVILIDSDLIAKMVSYLAKKGLQGKQMGMGIGKIRGVMKRMEGQDLAAIRAKIDKIEF